MIRTVDTVVIGGGTMGSMITWRLSARGQQVMCLESHDIAHSRSAVAGDTRLFRMSYRGKYDLFPILREAQTQWQTLNEESGEDILVNTGGIYIGHTNGDYIPELINCCERNYLDFEHLSAWEVQERFPQHNLKEDESAVLEHSAGFLRTERAVHAAFSQARRYGAITKPGTKAVNIEEKPDGVTITTSTGIIVADRAVIAAGLGTTKLLPRELQDALEARREILTWFPVINPTSYNSSNFPIFAHIDNSHSAYGAPSIDGSTFKATLDGRAKPIKDFPNNSYTLTPQEIAESEETADRFFNDIYPQVSRQECLADLYTPDKQALVGRLPDSDSVHVATGFSGTGFKMASGVGELIAQSITEQNDSMLPDFWDPSRFYNN